MNTYRFEIGNHQLTGLSFQFPVMADTPEDAVRLAREQLYEQMTQIANYSYLHVDLDFGLNPGKIVVDTSFITEDCIKSITFCGDPSELNLNTEPAYAGINPN
jgi:hypothetical protein